MLVVGSTGSITSGLMSGQDLLACPQLYSRPLLPALPDVSEALYQLEVFRRHPNAQCPALLATPMPKQAAVSFTGWIFFSSFLFYL